MSEAREVVQMMEGNKARYGETDKSRMAGSSDKGCCAYRNESS